PAFPRSWITVPLVASDQARLKLQAVESVQELVALPEGVTTSVCVPLDSGSRGGSAVPSPVAGAEGAAAATRPVAEEVAVAVPAPFVAVTPTRIVEPASPEPSR